MNDAQVILQENKQAYYMRGVRVEEILYQDPIPMDLYFFNQGHYNILLKKSDSLSIKQWDLLHKNIKEKNVPLFCHQEDRLQLNKFYQVKLRELTRSFSWELAKDKQKNKEFLKHFAQYYIHNFYQLYQRPYDTELLEVFYQANFGPAQTLVNSLDFLAILYSTLESLSYPYFIKQPLLSSFILLGFLAYTKQFSLKEMEHLYVVSTLKDIGMCFWPKTLFTQTALSPVEKNLILHHPKDSLKIVSNKIPLSSNYLNILVNHHLSGDKISGIETQLVHICDSVVAIIQGRPYKGSIDLFNALSIIKNTLPAQYNQEYKLFVLFLQTFFKKVS